MKKGRKMKSDVFSKSVKRHQEESLEATEKEIKRVENALLAGRDLSLQGVLALKEELEDLRALRKKKQKKLDTL
jgi:hypothetical protein